MLLQLHEHSYAPLKPHMVCLPAPQPPTERLLEAVEEFYYPPSEERQRNELVVTIDDCSLAVLSMTIIVLVRDGRQKHCWISMKQKQKPKRI